MTKIRLLVFVLGVVACVASTCADDYDDDGSIDCQEGQLCGVTCIPESDDCTEERQEAADDQCFDPPCCEVGQQCGDACISLQDSCTADDVGDVTPPSSCPTTSACGCSGLRKAECGGGCCRWRTGDGCGCR